MLNSGTQKRDQGFSLLEMLIAIGVVLLVAEITVPFVMNIVAGVNLRYAATRS
jgi:prepilin-type N-terminal cleavage/methylation domain-containing protein